MTVPPFPIIFLLVAVQPRIFAILFVPFLKVLPIGEILVMIPAVPIAVILVANSHRRCATAAYTGGNEYYCKKNWADVTVDSAHLLTLLSAVLRWLKPRK